MHVLYRKEARVMSTLHESDYCNKHEQWKQWLYKLKQPPFAPDFLVMTPPEVCPTTTMEKVWDCCKCFREKHQE